MVGAQIAREAYFKEKIVETKLCSTDLVTETDRNVEDFIISSLRSKYPTHRLAAFDLDCVILCMYTPV